MLLARFEEPIDLPRAERVALLGGKGDGLMRMAGELGMPVPPGFVLTTRACLQYEERGWTADLEAALREGIASLEQRTGRRFGGIGSPLLVSVRSGAPLSMPGMLDTILNVGLDAKTRATLTDENPRLARECSERLEDSFRSSVGRPAPAEAWTQLREAVEAVFRSAASPRALAYRRREAIAGASQTAVNVQAMVFGNRDERSATGVFFTRDPSTGEHRVYGDVLFRAQGEDVVSGRRATEPLTELERRMPDVAAKLFALGRELERDSRDLCEIEFTIESGILWLLQVRIGKRSPRAALRIASELALDPEFPFDRREAVLRVRDLLTTPPKIRSVRSSAAPPGASSAATTASPPLARGLPASPGIASGVVETDVARAVARSEAGERVLLVRSETSPEDVEGMSVAAGILTARGGLASHAAVVARGWGIPAVVGLESLSIDAEGIGLAGRRFAVGELLSIDGSTGEVFAGALEVEESIAPEVLTLLDWAVQLGIEISSTDPRVGPRSSSEGSRRTRDGSTASDEAAIGHQTIARSVDASSATSMTDSARDLLLQSLSIKGSATREALAAAILPLVAPSTDQASIAEMIDRLVGERFVAPAKPIGLRLAEAGQAQAQVLLERDRAMLGAPSARAALDPFQALDSRVKEAVTDWQLREVGGERVPNDHTDTAWDAAVIARLTSVAADATEWLAPLAERLPRLRGYAERIARALDQIGGGDARFVASPRVDSLHGVWFELHEDLIRLAGSSRNEERAAGRSA